MRIRSVKLQGFKRFDDLTIDLGGNPKKLIALVGPNGCGKSSVFDAFMLCGNTYSARTGEYLGAYNSPYSNPGYFSKSGEADYLGRISENIRMEFDQGDLPTVINRKRIDGTLPTLFSFRSSYRYSSQLDVREQRALEDIGQNTYGASYSADLDNKITVSY